MILVAQIKELLLSEGFFAYGVAKAASMESEEPHFKHAIVQGYHADQHYLAQNIPQRFQIDEFLPQCKSVIVALFHYGDQSMYRGDYKVARFRNVGNYQRRLKKRLKRVGEALQLEHGCQYMVSVDTSRVSEKNWGVRAGLGFVGKHSLLISERGTYFVMGIIAINEEVDEYSTPIEQSCANCGRCIKACPTQAIAAPYYIDSRKCLAYLTTRKEKDVTLVQQYGWADGCDACQEACPHNQKIF